MYNFIDVNEVSESAFLPSEALKINGEFIENQIEGYRTLNVSGREALSPDVVSFETGIRDGSRLKSKRYPERIITVQYQLNAESNEAFRDAYNKLGRILDVEDAELIFNDEQDKFYKGTPCIIGAVEPGRNSVVGEFEILCTDPFKYSVREYEAIASAEEKGVVLVDYNGTYKGFPILETTFHQEEDVSADGEAENVLTGNGDCGFVAFFNESEKVIQLGDPNEIDGTNDLPKSQTLVNQTFLTPYSWGTTAKKLWAVNSGSKLPYTIDQVGTVAMKADMPEEVKAEKTSASIASSTHTLLKKASTASTPTINYTVTARATNRTEKTVKVAVTITASLAEASNYFGKGYGLVGSVYIGGSWHDVTLKKTTDYWKGQTGHTFNLNVTLSDLTANTTAVTGIKFKAYRTDGLGTAGTVSDTACSNLTIPKYSVEAQAIEYPSRYLAASSYGTGVLYHGAAITRTISADASGEVGATDFTFTYRQKLCMAEGSTKQMGAFQMALLTNDGVCVAGVRVQKNTYVSTGQLFFYVNNEKVVTRPIDLTYTNPFFGADSKSVQTSTVKKSGNTINFNIGGSKLYVKRDNIADLKVTKIVFTFEQYSNLEPFAYNGLYTAKFVKNNCSTWNEIPNKFSANDVLEADCRSGEIYLNGIRSPELGAHGNDWENFYLTPGLNQIGVAYSDWITDDYAPLFKVKYREVFL